MDSNVSTIFISFVYNDIKVVVVQMYGKKYVVHTYLCITYVSQNIIILHSEHCELVVVSDLVRKGE